MTPRVNGPPREIAHRHVSDRYENLRQMRDGPARPPLVLIHAMGGRLSGSYVPLVSRLAGERPVYLVLYPRFGDRAPALTSVEDMAEHYVDILEVLGPGPLHLCGWSLGGAIAYQMAQVRERRGKPAGFLALIDSWIGLHRQRDQPRPAEAQKIASYLFWSYVMKLTGGAIAGAADPAHGFWQLDDSQKLDQVETAALAAAPDLFPQRGSRAFLDAFTMFANLWNAGENYKPRRGTLPFVYFASSVADPDVVRFWLDLNDKARCVESKGNHDTMMDIAYAAGMAKVMSLEMRHHDDPTDDV